jgi:hypothetical protein
MMQNRNCGTNKSDLEKILSFPFDIKLTETAKVTDYSYTQLDEVNWFVIT